MRTLNLRRASAGSALPTGVSEAIHHGMAIPIERLLRQFLLPIPKGDVILFHKLRNRAKLTLSPVSE